MLRLVCVCLLFATFILNGFAQSGAPVIRKLTESEQALIEGSKKAIIETGISETYFATHFKLLNVIDKASDRRVVWQFSVDQYQAILNDSIGYYTAATKRIDTHSIENTLGQTSEIRRTLTRTRALRIMKSCIGSFENPVVEYGPVEGHAELLLVAYTRNRTENKSEREREREGEREEREKRRAVDAGTDAIKSEGEEGEHAPIILGAVNLQTGKCTKGAALIAP
jgi:hypothetical protein